MASEQEAKLHLSLWVDKGRNRVVVAEANGDFIDILFSFLTLPMGTIIRILSKKQGHDETPKIGCINNLYQSVENSRDDVFWNHICKRMFVYPRNPSEELCQKLKLKVDDTEPTKYFMCSNNCQKGDKLFLSTFAEASCLCGKLMDKEMKQHGDGIFVKGQTMYLIFDDLRVLQSSPGNTVQQLVQLGYKSFHKLTEMSQHVGLEEILELLKQALTSNSPLSDVLLGNRDNNRMCTNSPKYTPGNGEEFDYCYSSPTINLKIIVRKSDKKIMYAEAEEDFVDFPFSFLTAPLGSQSIMILCCKP